VPLIEEVVRLPAGEGLAGILTHSSDLVSADHPAALLLDVGLTYRVGPSRLHVRLARQLATSGIPTLRFDFSGNGDSPHRSDALAFAESAPLETTKAMDWLSQRLGVQRFLLLGILLGREGGVPNGMPGRPRGGHRDAQCAKPQGKHVQ